MTTELDRIISQAQDADDVQNAGYAITWTGRPAERWSAHADQAVKASNDEADLADFGYVVSPL